MSKFIFLKSLQTILTPLKRLIDRKAENVSWNESDPSSKGYIAGRTHYKEEKNVIYIQDEQVLFNNNDGMYIANVTRLNASVGDILTVIWDGVEYECNVALFEDAYILGNSSILFGNEVENTGEPFLWGYNDGFSQIYTLDTSEYHTISCYGKVSVVHKIPNEYLPDMIGKNGKGENAEIFNDYTNNIANGDYAHAEGSGTHAVSYAHAEGYRTEALSQYSHTEGYYTSAQQYASHAEGEWTYANGRVSHAEGSNTRANSPCQHVQGKYNIEDWNSKYAHIVGNGSYSERKNAHTIDWNGLGWFAGGVKVGGAGQDDENAIEVALKPDIPVNVSELANDAGYLTEHQDLSDYALKAEIPNVPVKSVNGKTGDITLIPDDIGAQAAGDYALNSELKHLAFADTVVKSDLESSVQESLNKADTALQSFEETDPTVPAWAKAETKPAYTPEEVGAAPADHPQSASTITAGTFEGEVVASASAQTPATALLRNSKLVTAETNPTNNGEIYWMYE